MSVLLSVRMRRRGLALPLRNELLGKPLDPYMTVRNLRNIVSSKGMNMHKREARLVLG